MVDKTPGSRRERASQRGAKKTVPAVKRLNKINFARESKKGNAWKVETEVICVRCKTKFFLPFKPRRPDIYCEKCFKLVNKK